MHVFRPQASRGFAAVSFAKGGPSVRRHLSAFLGGAHHRHDSSVMADPAARGPVTMVVTVVVRSDVRDDCDPVDDRISAMARGKLTAIRDISGTCDDSYGSKARNSNR